MGDSTSREQLERECGLYRRLLDLGAEREIEPFLREALALVVEVTGGARGYLELSDPESEPKPAWWMSHGFSPHEAEDVRRLVSSGIIAETLATGETVVTSSALLDPRFLARESVRVGRIQAVLCTPLGRDPALGVLYLERANGATPWSAHEQELAETFSRNLAPLADRLLLRARARARADATESLRKTLRLESVVGRSRALAQALHQASLVAPLDVSVLLTGETGTGKGQLARVIHQNSPRSGGPFVEVNCAALPESLIESELFGAEQGAHSTAVRALRGKVAAADGGTLVLDEVAELSLTAQAKLLQLLQSREYFPLGAAEPVRASVRVIAATNQDLELAVAEKRIRADLYFRLQVVTIRLPALSERREDLLELATHFCRGACERHGLPQLALSPGAVRAIESAPWPGNVRQLEHSMEAAAIRAAGERATVVERRHVFPDAAEASGGSEELSFQEATRRFQRDLLLRTLEATGWNVTQAARRLDLARSHVYNLLRAFGLGERR